MHSILYSYTTYYGVYLKRQKYILINADASYCICDKKRDQGISNSKLLTSQAKLALSKSVRADLYAWAWLS